MDTPVVIFIYNRARETSALLDVLRKAKPTRLLVVADGPKDEEDRLRCQAVRELVNVDWKCNISTKYASYNLGCRLGVVAGLNWAFDKVDRAVILEDDCIPHISFFQFATLLLERHEESSEIMAISGSQPLNVVSSEFSYFYSKYSLIWGWATWRRAWRKYDIDMTHWPAFARSKSFAEIHPERAERSYWESRLERTFNGHSTWDNQWTLACWRNRGLTIVPTRNLVQNIGFSSLATHTQLESEREALSLPALKCQFPLSHPSKIAHNTDFDTRLFGELFQRKRCT